MFACWLDPKSGPSRLNSSSKDWGCVTVSLCCACKQWISGRHSTHDLQRANSSSNKCTASSYVSGDSGRGLRRIKRYSASL
jgi:hypothetical protein